MPNSSELEALRTRILAARRAPEPIPPRAAQYPKRHARARQRGWSISDLVVTNTGEIRAIQDVGASTAVSRVTTEIFSSQVDEAAWASQYLPSNHWRYNDDEVSGWAYNLTTTFGDTYTMFLYWDRYQKVYRVRLLDPPLERLGLVHETHLFSDGHLCLSRSAGGERLFNNAYAKSAMWADGISRMIRGHAWPWGE
jgi:hypothetical protein